MSDSPWIEMSPAYQGKPGGGDGPASPYRRSVWVSVSRCFAVLALVGIGVCVDASNAGAVDTPRPHGLNGIIAQFGQPCSAQATQGSVYIPFGNTDTSGNPVLVHVHAQLSNEFSDAVAHTYWAASTWLVFNRFNQVYNCRKKRNSSSWSTHAWGIAMDVAIIPNPAFCTTWNGIGANWVNYGWLLPFKFTDPQLGNLYWGLNFGDCQHFQYATGY